jgi:hypothetical protein
MVLTIFCLGDFQLSPDFGVHRFVGANDCHLSACSSEVGRAEYAHKERALALPLPRGSTSRPPGPAPKSRFARFVPKVTGATYGRPSNRLLLLIFPLGVVCRACNAMLSICASDVRRSRIVLTKGIFFHHNLLLLGSACRLGVLRNWIIWILYD